ncbi:hypothetical protein BHE74_00017214 [Ensete ventricosum]|nr:hypothetical protein BHE74_00017214 [Ensete ventricosum]
MPWPPISPSAALQPAAPISFYISILPHAASGRGLSLTIEAPEELALAGRAKVPAGSSPLVELLADVGGVRHEMISKRHMKSMPYVLKEGLLHASGREGKASSKPPARGCSSSSSSSDAAAAASCSSPPPPSSCSPFSFEDCTDGFPGKILAMAGTQEQPKAMSL